MGMFKRALFALELFLLLFISGLTGAARSPGLRWSSAKWNIVDTWYYNGSQCVWHLEGDDKKGVTLGINCMRSGVVITENDILWDEATTVRPYIISISMWNVSTINPGRFRGMEALRIFSPGHLRNIPDNLFEGCTNLTTPVLPKSGTYIGTKAFFGCKSMHWLKLPSTLTHIGESAFEGSGIRTIELKQPLTLEKKVFAGCKELTTVTMPAMDLPESIFEECSNLSTITVQGESEPFRNVGNRVFFGCSALTAIEFDATVIGDSAFEGCGKLASLRTLEKVQSIGNRAFFQCASLRINVAASSMTSVGGSAFEGSGILSFFASKVQTANFQVGVRAFACCKALTTVVLPPTMTEIPAGLFDGCSKLITLDSFPTNPTSVGARAFAGCEKLGLQFAKSDTLSSIGESAFAGSGIISFEAGESTTFTLGTSGFAS